MPAPFGNKFALGNNGGRPPKYETPEQLETKILEYFTSIDTETGNYPTVTGLALFLGFCSRQGLYEYRDKDEFSDLVKRALTVVESHYETRLNSGAPTGAIFALKNMNWKDTTDLKHSGEIKNSYSDLTEDEIKERLERIGNRP